MRFQSICISLVVAATVAGCSPAKWGHFDIPFDEARARLLKADIVGFRDARQCGYLIHFSLNTPNPESVGWVVRYREKTVASFFVHLTPAGSGVDANFVIPAASDGGEIYDGKQAYDYPVLLQPLRPALQELVDSAMEQRSFDQRRIASEPPSGGSFLGGFNSAKDRPPISQTQAYCFEGRQTLERGVAWSMDDPPGFPPSDYAQRLK